MGFVGFFGRGKGKSIPPNATFRLTQVGTEKLQEFGGDPKSRILVALETGGTSTIDEISRTSGVGKGTVEKLIPGMITGRYIEYISASREDI